MRKQILIVVSLCLLIGLAAVPVYAQAGGVLQAKIPFNFTVSGKTFSAGDYRMNVSSHQLRIEGMDGRTVAMALVTDSGRSAEEKGQIIFRCYRNRCYLAEVWPLAFGNVRTLSIPKLKAGWQGEGQGQYFAVLAEPLGK